MEKTEALVGVTHCVSVLIRVPAQACLTPGSRHIAAPASVFQDHRDECMWQDFADDKSFCKFSQSKQQGKHLCAQLCIAYCIIYNIQMQQARQMSPNKDPII